MPKIHCSQIQHLRNIYYIQIDKMLVEQPEHDNLGEEFCERIRQGCRGQGYQFKFYTLSTNPEFDYEVVVK